jgi:hypothetical protein
MLSLRDIRERSSKCRDSSRQRRKRVARPRGSPRNLLKWKPPPTQDPTLLSRGSQVRVLSGAPFQKDFARLDRAEIYRRTQIEKSDRYRECAPHFARSISGAFFVIADRRSHAVAQLDIAIHSTRVTRTLRKDTGRANVRRDHERVTDTAVPSSLTFSPVYLPADPSRAPSHRRLSPSPQSRPSLQSLLCPSEQSHFR